MKPLHRPSRSYVKGLFSVALGVLALTEFAAAAPKSEADFLQDFKSAVGSKDVRKIMALYCLDGATESAKQSLLRDLQPLVKLKIKSVELAEIPRDEKATFEKGIPFEGKRLVPNLSPVKQVVVTFEHEPKVGEDFIADLTLPIGKKGAEYFFTTTKLVD